MIITTLYALIYQIFNQTGYLVEKNIALVIISLLLIVFALIVFIEAIKDIFKKSV
jgi:hypothetical protein